MSRHRGGARLRAAWVRRRVGRLLAALWLAVLAGGCATPLTVALKSTPPGATVTEAQLGSLGVTDTVYQVPASAGTDPQHWSLVFDKPGYEPRRLETIVRGPDAMVHVTLSPLATRLEVEVFPAFASVRVTTLDGRPVDTSGFDDEAMGLNEDALWVGRASLDLLINVSAPGYKPVREQITLRRGEKRKESYALSEAMAMIQVKTEPSGVDVYDRWMGYLGRTPFRLTLPVEKLVRASHRRDLLEQADRPQTAQLQLRFEKPGYRTLEVVTDVQIAGENYTEIVEWLTPVEATEKR
jgi:hypothetical protein